MSGGGQVNVGHWGTGVQRVIFARELVFLDEDGGRKIH